jgi:hypothetical protein
MNKYLGYKVPKCGAMDSKYWNQPELFEKDIAHHNFEDRLLREEFRNLLLRQPDKLKNRYYAVIEELRSIKDEFRL